MEPEEKPTPATPTPSTPGGGTSGLALVAGQMVGHGRFTLIRQLGKGGMGVVWLARDQSLAEEVALKFLATEISNDPSALDDMRRETQKSRKLTHPNIIRIHDFVESKDEPAFISMEYIEGQPLNALKAQQPQRCFDWETLKPLVKQLCDALEYAHGEKVIHRDLKPANMMLDGRGRLKLADFGIAAVASESKSRVSLKHATSGTVVYMSPQQMNGQKPHPTDDLYALGATLYELLTSKPPFYHGDVIHQVQNVEPKPLAERLAELGVTNDIPPDVSAMVLACLSKDHAQRPPSAQAVAERIGLTSKTASPSEPAAGVVADSIGLKLDVARAMGSGWRGRKSLWVAAVVGVMVIAGVWINRRGNGAPPLAGVGTTPFRIEDGWTRLFAPGNIDKYGDPKRWEWSGDVFVGFSDKPAGAMDGEAYTNAQVKAEIRFKRGGGGSVILRANRPKKPPPPVAGYAIRIGNTEKGFRQTGTLLKSQDVLEQVVNEDEWFTLHGIVVGNRVVVRLNERTAVDYVDSERKHASGRLGLIHGGGAAIMFRNIRIQPLPADETAAWKEVRKAAPDLK